MAVTGGGPMAVAGPMVLCARSDLSPNRFYSGRIANLGVYNTSISAPAMATLYDQASGSCAVLTRHDHMSVALRQAAVQSDGELHCRTQGRVLSMVA